MVYGENPEQIRPFSFAFVQGEWVAVEIGEALLAVVLKLVDIVVCGELRIAISTKWSANPPAASICEAVGARFIATAGKLQVAPRL